MNIITADDLLIEACDKLSVDVWGIPDEDWENMKSTLATKIDELFNLTLKLAKEQKVEK